MTRSSLPIPLLVALAAVVYFARVRGYDWGPAAVAGLALAFLGFGLRRSVGQLHRAWRQHRAPLNLRFTWQDESVGAEERPGPDHETGQQQGMGQPAADPTDQQQKEPSRDGGCGQP